MQIQIKNRHMHNITEDKDIKAHKSTLISNVSNVVLKILIMNLRK